MLVIISSNRKESEIMMVYELHNNSKKAGLNINVGKTKIYFPFSKNSNKILIIDKPKYTCRNTIVERVIYIGRMTSL